MPTGQPDGVSSPGAYRLPWNPTVVGALASVVSCGLVIGLTLGVGSRWLIPEQSRESSKGATISGWVRKATAKGRTVRLSSTIPGVTITITIPEHVGVRVGESFGSFGDLRWGRRVTIEYGSQDGVNVARAVQVLGPK